MTSQGQHPQISNKPSPNGQPSARPSGSTVPLMSLPPSTSSAANTQYPKGATVHRRLNRGHGHTQSQGHFSSSTDPTFVQPPSSPNTSQNNHTLHISENIVYPAPPRFASSANSPVSPLSSQHPPDLENALHFFSNQNTPLEPPSLASSSSSSSFHRSISPSVVISRPNSRGVNFSRPSTFYKLENVESSSSSKGLRQDSLSSSSDDTSPSRFHSPHSSPTKSSLHVVDSYPSDRTDRSLNEVHHPPLDGRTPTSSSDFPQTSSDYFGQRSVSSDVSG